MGGAVSCNWVKAQLVHGGALLNGSIRDVHASRLKHYADSSFEVTEEVVERIANQNVYLTVREFVEHSRSGQHGYEIFVAWEGLEDIENSWEPIKTMHKDVKTKLQQYVNQAGDPHLARHIEYLNAGHHVSGALEVLVQLEATERKRHRGGKPRATSTA